jgi:cyclophilin family peptidyl-prolyl cis-trans isomerase
MKSLLFAALAAVAIATGARAANPVVVMETSMGTIKIELFEDKAPATVKNFLSYVDDKFYDNTIFHRVIKGFMDQCGGFDTDRKEKKTKGTIKNEWQNGLKNVRGTIAMARLRDPDTASAQFFINVADNSAGLNTPRQETGFAGYCVFGKVIDGMDVVDKINNVATGTMRFQTPEGAADFRDVPNEQIVIKSVKLEKK